MTKILSPGKWRGLKATSSANHGFAILAFDQRASYRRMLPDSTSYETAIQIKSDVASGLSPVATAVLLDPIYGLKATQTMAGSSGLLMALEKTGYSGESRARRVDFIDGWDVAKIKQMGASAAKLLVYYNPDTGSVAEAIEATIRRVATTCQQHDLPLFVEPLCYSADDNIPKSSAAFAQERPRLVRETVKRLSETGADVLKVEFPIDAAFDTDEGSWRAACEAISEVATVPWALLSAGVDFEVFEQQVRVACQSGASGFLGGRAIWKEVVTMDSANRQTFIRDVARSRLSTLRQIVEDYAHPWTAYYDTFPTLERWFETYSG